MSRQPRDFAGQARRPRLTGTLIPCRRRRRRRLARRLDPCDAALVALALLGFALAVGLAVATLREEPAELSAEALAEIATEAGPRPSLLERLRQRLEALGE